MPIPNWVTSEAWDILNLGGMRIPGVAKVKVKAKSGLDIKKPKGGKKATTKDDGDPPTEFSADISMSHEDLVEFGEILGVLRPVTKDGARSPLKADHPVFALMGVSNVSVGDIEIDPPESGSRISVSIEIIEWTPAPAKVAKAKTKPEDDGEAGAWAQFAADQVGRFFGAMGGQAEPDKKSPSSDAGKNI